MTLLPTPFTGQSRLLEVTEADLELVLAAIVAAVEDALRPVGARLTATPVRPEAVWRSMHTSA